MQSTDDFTGFNWTALCCLEPLFEHWSSDFESRFHSDGVQDLVERQENSSRDACLVTVPSWFKHIENSTSDHFGAYSNDNSKRAVYGVDPFSLRTLCAKVIWTHKHDLAEELENLPEPYIDLLEQCLGRPFFNFFLPCAVEVTPKNIHYFLSKQDADLCSLEEQLPSLRVTFRTFLSADQYVVKDEWKALTEEDACSCSSTIWQVPSLSFRAYNHTHCRELKDIIRRHFAVKELEFHATLIDNDTLLSLSKHLHELTSLSFNGNEIVSAIGLQPLLRSNRHLCSLTLSRCFAVNDEVMVFSFTFESSTHNL